MLLRARPGRFEGRMLSRGGAGIDWREQALQDELAAVSPGLRVELRTSVDSTNTRLLDLCRAHHGPRFDPVLLVAEAQTGGRGRHGRAWTSAPGASLTFSLALQMPRADLSGLSLAVGVALAEALDPAARPSTPRLLLKWPNDLWLRGTTDDALHAGRKLGGILIETVNRGAACLVVIGVGVNVLPLAVDAPRSGVAWLREIDAALSAPQALHRVAAPLLQALEEFDRKGFAAFEARYAARDLLFGRDVSAGEVQGVAMGVASNGALRLRPGADPNAPLQHIVSGEVSVRLARPAPTPSPSPARAAC
jgi:BirA family transcriptional regulator, biotin operon repressor / biotin---[acetyl-CoA-carboxylase] ligase